MFALGLGDQLVGVSDLCDYPPAARHKPVVSRSLIDTAVLSSAEVDAKMRALLAAGASPFHIEAAVLHQEPPDLVLTQDTCAICDATAADVQRAIDGIRPPPELLILSPRTVSEIFASIMAVGQAAGAPDRACTLVASLEARVHAIASTSRARIPPTTAGVARRGEPAGGRRPLDSRAENAGWRSGRSVHPGVRRAAAGVDHHPRLRPGDPGDHPLLVRPGALFT